MERYQHIAWITEVSQREVAIIRKNLIHQIGLTSKYLKNSVKSYEARQKITVTYTFSFICRTSNLEPEQYYFFSVTAKTRLGWGKTAQVVVYTISNREHPQPPSTPVISSSQVQANQITFSWVPGSDGFAPLRFVLIKWIRKFLFSNRFTGVFFNFSVQILHHTEIGKFRRLDYNSATGRSGSDLIYCNRFETLYKLQISSTSDERHSTKSVQSGVARSSNFSGRLVCLSLYLVCGEFTFTEVSQFKQHPVKESKM